MTKQEILSRMMREEHSRLEINLYSLAALFAEKLSLLEDRLEQGELDGLIEIGSAIYRRGRTEFHENVPVEDMFPMGDGWKLGPGKNRSGYTKQR